MRHLSIDIETYSSIDIKKSGMYKYAQSQDFEILLIGFAWDDQPPYIIDMQKPREEIAYPLEIISQALRDPQVIKHAYNAPFEWYCLNRAGFYTPLDQWRCTMLHGLYCGYNAGLGATAIAIGLPSDKQKDNTGRALIKYFCVPRTPTMYDPRTRNYPHHDPARWEMFKSYCAQDVVVEREIERRLSPWPVPDDEQRLWMLDQQINAHGVAVDMTLVDGAMYCDSVVTQKLTEEAVSLSGLDNPNSVAQLKAWLTDETGEEVTNLRKDTVKEMVKAVDDETVKRMLELRQELSRTSVKKYAAIREVVCDDGRVHGLLFFYGASRTGRWASRLVQIQNLPRNYIKTLSFAREAARSKNVDMLRLMYGNVPDTLSQLTRTAFVPSPGRRLIVADFSAIEARVIAWLAGEKWAMEAFATHGLIYEATASAMFGVPIELIKKGNPEYELRQRGKVAVLACGYQGSVPALKKQGADKMGLSDEELLAIVQRWRSANKNIVGLWRALEKAAVDTVRTGRQNGTHGLLLSRECSATGEEDFLTITLPNGRKLFYAHPSTVVNDFGRDAVQYMGTSQDTKSKGWGPIMTYGGRLAENVVQGISRDCLAVAISRISQQGYQIVFHVHDEVVIDATPDQRLEDVLDIMRQPIPWAPGLILNAAGFYCDFYQKD